MNKDLLSNQIRECSDCPLRQGCQGPVPGIGPVPARVMLIGEAPGEQEDREGEPFVGQAGRLLNYLLSSMGLSREQCYISNVLKCRPPNNATPTAAQVRACAHWLDAEIEAVQPGIIALMGAPAIRRMLGSGAGTVEHLHGIPIVRNDNGRRIIYLPSYHPAFALHDTAQLRLVYDDFRILGGLISGDDPNDYIIKDEFPDPEYIEITDRKHLDWLHSLIDAASITNKPVAADVETVDNKLWSVQLAITPGTAYFVGPDLIDYLKFHPDVPYIFHNYLYDYQFVKVNRFIDTMVMAYQLGLPQGLKELAHRLCGMEMQSYRDLVSGAGRERAIEYITRVAGIEWPKPKPVTEFKWDNKAGGLINKVRNPQPMGRKAKRILDDIAKDSETDPYDRWSSIDASERAVVESKLGILSASTIADIPHGEAAYYANRDPDATLRVYQALLPRIHKYGLDFILDIDLSVLPVVQEMMDVGFGLDVDYLKGLSEEYAGRMIEVSSGLAKEAGHPFNPGSSKQVADVVYGELGFTPTHHTDTGLISTDDRELKKVDHPIIKNILKYRKIAKNKDSFADSLIEKVVKHDDGYRIHTTLKATRVETGRLSSSNPNLQAMPIRHKEGKRIRKGFIATDGK